MEFFHRYILYILGPLTLAFLLQLALLDLTKSRFRFLRWSALLPLTVPVGQVLVCCWKQMFLWQLGVVYYLGIVLLWLTGWSAAWKLHRWRQN